MKRYSLADYMVSITPDDSSLKSIFKTITIGGQGKYIGSISVSQANDLWSTTGFATGAWIHEKNLDRHGSCEIEIGQLATEVMTLIRLFNMYYQGDYAGCTILVTDRSGNTVATCNDSYIVKAADQEFSETSGRQNWGFTCGEVIFG